MIAAVTTTRLTALGLRVLWVVVSADADWLMLPVKAAWRCQHVCGSRYADDMRRLVASRSKTEARRALKRHCSDTVFQALLAEATAPAVDLAEAA
jgi:hypothetical protein